MWNASTRIRRVAGIAIAVTALIGVAGCSAGEQPPEETSPAPTSTYRGGTNNSPDQETGDDTKPTQEGQSIGDYDPLLVPDGIPVGITTDTAPDLWTVGMGERQNVELGDTAIIHVDPLMVQYAEQNMTVAIAVDDVTEPISGPERDVVLTDLGYSPEHQIVLQKITMRVRIVQQPAPESEEPTGFNLADIIDVKSDVGGNMPFHFYPDGINGNACKGSWDPMEGHDASRGDTVQVCGYVTGDLNTDPMMWVYGVQLESTWDNKYRDNAMIMSDAWNPKTHTGEGE